MNGFKSFFNRGCWFIKKKLNHAQLKNKTITIISQNCLGGVLYHDYGLEFLYTVP